MPTSQIQNDQSVVFPFPPAQRTIPSPQADAMAEAQPPYACVVQPDAAGRIASVTRDGVPVEAYAYDAQGRRVMERNLLRGVETRPYVYNAAGGHLDSAGPLRLRHDIRETCNATWRRDEGTEYEYANDGKLLRVARPDGVLVQYAYDANGDRVAKLVNGCCLQRYLWLDRLRLGAVSDAANDLLVRFGYMDNARLPWGIRCDAGDYFLLYDQVGSLRVVADAAGKVIQEIEYDTFGSILRETGEGFVLPFGFAGGLHDRDTGLVCFGVRDYLPELGRFMAKDPLGLKGGDPDVYGYCLDDPVNRVDPSGMSWEDILNAGSAIASGVGNAVTKAGEAATTLPGKLHEAAGIMKKTIPTSPRYGNWGGEYWSGGQDIRRHGGVSGSRSPVDSSDVLYQNHDQCYDGCAHGASVNACKGDCDAALVDGLTQLPNDPAKWPTSPANAKGYAQLYRWMAKEYFK